MRRLALLLCLAAASARADDNDVQLYRLGHPDELNCTRCDGQPGDSKEPPTSGAQQRFHRFASLLGLAFAPPFQETAGTLGQAGFEIGLSSSQAFLRVPDDAWATAGSEASRPAPSVLVLPTLTVRKGLGASLELGAAVSWLVNSQMAAFSGEVRFAPIDSVQYLPDLGLRAWGTRVVGTQELDLTAAGADALLSKSFGLAGVVKLQPYVQGGVQFINASSGVVDFKPGVENSLNPTADDGTFHNIGLFKNRFLRGAAGLRLVAGVVVLGLEGSLAQGTNAVQDDAPRAGEPPVAKNFIRLWSGAARLGFSF